MLSALLSDTRLALRSMRRHPAFTAVVAGTLALGIGANTAMFALVHAALLRPLPYKQPDRLVLAAATFSGKPGLETSAPDYYDYEQHVPAFKSLAASKGSPFSSTITGAGGSPEHVLTMEVSYHLFPTLGVEPVEGRCFTKEEDTIGGAPVVMISEGLATRRFGHASKAVGQGLTVTGMGGRGAALMTIVGVMPARFEFMGQADLWLPTRRGREDGPGTRAFRSLVLVGRLASGVSTEQAQRQVDVITGRLQQEYPKTNKNKGLRLSPLEDAIRGSNTSMLMILMGAVALVLLIACANVAGLLLARGMARRSELAVRAAIGASRGRIAGQLLTESLVLSGLGGIGGVLLALWLQRLLPAAAGLGNQAGAAPRGLEAPVLLFALGASLVAGVLSGVAPALRAASPNLSANLAPGARATESKGGSRLRSLLVVGQVALSLVLLVGAGLLLRSLALLAAADLGFKTPGLLVACLDQPYAPEAMRIQFQKGLGGELATIPGVTDIALTSQVPIMHPGGNPPAWPAAHPPADASEQRTIFRRIVAGGYFRTLGIPLVAGRDFTASDRQGTPNVTVIDEIAAREFFPGGNPIGERLMITAMRPGDRLDTPTEFEVIGVVGPARINRVGVPAMATAYVSSEQFGMGRVNLVLRSSLSPSALTQTIRKAVAAQHPGVAVDEVIRMEDVVRRNVESRRVMAVTLGGFSAVALLLAALGLYGVLAFYVSQRGHEIGVRLALGAQRGAILRQVLARSAMMVGPGLILGLVASRAGSRVMRQFLYQVQPTDMGTFAGVSVALAVVAFAASVWPAWRAARLDPVRALRGE